IVSPGVQMDAILLGILRRIAVIVVHLAVSGATPKLNAMMGSGSILSIVINVVTIYLAVRAVAIYTLFVICAALVVGYAVMGTHYVYAAPMVQVADISNDLIIY
ncbi:unnamed protein product, partial [marine sediment metagenome]